LTVDYGLLTIDYWLFTIDCWLLTVDCQVFNACCGTWTSFWEKDEDKHCLLLCGRLWWLLTIDYWLLPIAYCLLTVDYWRLTIDCWMHVVGYELRFWKKMRTQHCLLWCCRLWWLLTVDCRMHVVGHEFRFWKKMRENIVCYCAVACDDCWRFTVDCWLLTIDCWLLAVECMLWDMNFVLGRSWGKTLSVMVLSFVTPHAAAWRAVLKSQVCWYWDVWHTILHPARQNLHGDSEIQGEALVRTRSAADMLSNKIQLRSVGGSQSVRDLANWVTGCQSMKI
jgi:hypothetical protein